MTLAAISVAEPRSTPAYQPIRGTLVHHVSHVSSPCLRNHRTEYHPASLTMSASPSRSSEPSVPTRVFPALCPSTEKALPRPPVNKGHVAVAKPQLVRSSTSIQLTRSKLASDNAFLVETVHQLIAAFWQFICSMCITAILTICR